MIEIDGARRKILADIELDLGRRLLVVPRRPDDFDARKSDRRQLELYGLPAPPEKDQLALRLWEDLVSAPLQPESTACPVLPFPVPDLDYQLNYNQFSARGHHRTSRNWSGVVISARNGREAFTTLYGRWKVPMPRLPAHARAGSQYACSAWIGLDGDRRTSWSLPQIGTTQYVKRVQNQPVVVVEAWWQWWMKGHQNPPVRFCKFPLNPGDEVVCSIEVKSHDSVIFNLTNVTQNVGTVAVSVLAPFPSPSGSTSPKPWEWPVRGVAAEWILERPTIWASTEMYPLPDYTSLTHKRCLAINNRSEPRGLGASTSIDMIETLDAPPRSAVISRVRKINSHRAKLTYQKH